ncbi:uncharacterized protein LOC127240890 [Andrographis paniculata]|uniref:uncharacterized protein LOC127240890 n=1 Tax=Andrographis paniculata TaxID=175694 RepID=UPI0021E91FCD|nr:uncharacterized protein LOC127240890 [Andrographis paniculata]
MDIDKFYTTWAIKVEAIMEAQGVWEAIEPEEGAAVEGKKDKAARALLLQALSEDLLLQVAQKKMAKEVWDSLKTRFIGADRVKAARLQTLKSEFDGLRMSEGETLEEYAGKLSGMSAKYTSLGATNDAEMVKKLFDTVPTKYYPVIARIEQFCDLTTMPFEEAVGRLKMFEERIRQTAPSGNNGSQLLLAQTDWKGQQYQGGKERNLSEVSGNRGRGGRGRGRGRDRGEHTETSRRENTRGSGGEGRDKSHIRCYNCNKVGHYASECWSKQRKVEANLTCTEENEPALLLSAAAEREN